MTSQIIAALMQAPLEKPSSVQNDATSSSKFYATDKLAADTLTLQVSGVGKLALPLKKEDVARLLAVSSAAKFGLREQTLLDKDVRDTAEIAADQIQIEDKSDLLPQMLQQMANRMGLAANAKLHAHLHNLLIYGPGQFFKTHQDSEKLHGMVASLVVVLPSPHIGGDLIIQQGKDIYHFVSENLADEELKCIAFYADCQHEISRVKQGYRVALTFNLVLENSPEANADESFRNPKLEQAIASYFADQAADNSASPNNARPAMLCYCLDHAYSEHSLRWNFLKGSDTQRGQAFLCAAKSLGLIPMLALLEKHESWTAYDDEYGNDVEPVELIGSENMLTHWIASDNLRLPYRQLNLYEEEICWTLESGDDDLLDSEYEGFTGNAGNTLDYWYRRAAIVLWQAKDDVAMQFLLDYDNALQNLAAQCDKATDHASSTKQIRQTLQQAGRHLHQPPHASNKAAHFAHLAKIAIFLEDADFASSLFGHFSISALTIEYLPAMLSLQQAYGLNWCVQLLAVWQEAWLNTSIYQRSRNEDAANGIDQFVAQFIAMGGANEIAGQVLKHHVDAVIQDDVAESKMRPIDRMASQHKRNERLEKMLLASSVIKDAAIDQLLLTHVMGHTELYPQMELAQVVLGIAERTPALELSGVASLHEHIVLGIKHELQAGVRQKDDWALACNFNCSCQDCQTALAFLHAKEESDKIWPMAEVRRRHTISQLNALGLPLDVTVRKQGSPHKLVISKNPQLFEQAKVRFAKLQELQTRMAELR